MKRIRVQQQVQQPVKYHGLTNQGSTCYLNSVLQVLFMTKEFREAVNRFVEENPDTQFIDCHLKDLFDDLLRQTTSAHRIIQALGIDRVYERQDAAEYLERILRLTSPSSTQMFHGQMAHRTTCSVCKTESDRDGAFWHLPLDLSDSSSGNFSVEEGIETFFRASEFRGKNQMYCDTCDAKVNATSKYVIKHHPDVLILLLKRFKFNHQHSSFIKVRCFVGLPSTLKLQKFFIANQTQTYELYAVVDHLGDLRSGHYITVIKSQDDGERWFSFNDTKVSRLKKTPFPDNMNRSDKAYLLFYRRKEAAAGTEEPMEACMNEDQSAASQTLKGEDTQRAKRTCLLNQDTKIHPIFKSADGELASVSTALSKHSNLNNALKRLKTSQKKHMGNRQKNETESSDSQQRSSEGDSNVLPNIKCKKFKQSGGEDGLKSADAEKERIHVDHVKEKRKGKSESGGDDNQEVGAAAGEVGEKTQRDQELRRNSSRNIKRKKEGNRSDESRESDQSKVGDQHEQRRLKSMKKPHPDEGPLDQETHVSGSHKTQKKASKRQDGKQKTGGGDSQRRSGSETERLRQNKRAEEEETKLESIQNNGLKVENERKMNREFDSAHGTKTSLPSSVPDESSLSRQQKHMTGKERRKTTKNRTDQSDGHGPKTYSGVELESPQGKNKQKKSPKPNMFTQCFRRK